MPKESDDPMAEYGDKGKEYFDLTKEEQLRKLDSLGIGRRELNKLKYEKDRVEKLLELMEE